MLIESIIVGPARGAFAFTSTAGIRLGQGVRSKAKDVASVQELRNTGSCLRRPTLLQ